MNLAKKDSLHKFNAIADKYYSTEYTYPIKQVNRLLKLNSRFTKTRTMRSKWSQIPYSQNLTKGMPLKRSFKNGKIPMASRIA